MQGYSEGKLFMCLLQLVECFTVRTQVQYKHLGLTYKIVKNLYIIVGMNCKAWD